MAGVRAFNFLTDEEIGFRKVKSGVFGKFKKKGVRPHFLGFLSAELIAGGPGRSWNHSRPLKQPYKINNQGFWDLWRRRGADGG